MKYTVIGHVAQIGAGEFVELTRPQADARRHALKEGRGMRFEAAQPLEFKRGEVIGLDTKPDDLPRYLGDILRPVTAEEIKTANRAHGEAVATAEGAQRRGRERVAKEKAAKTAKTERSAPAKTETSHPPA